MSAIQIQLEGQNAAQSAEAFQQFLLEQFNINADLCPISSSEPSAGEKALSDRQIAIIGIALALPGFINDTTDLVSRIETTKKVEQIINWAKEQQKEFDTRFWWVSDDNKPSDLGKAQGSQLRNKSAIKTTDDENE